MLMIRIVGPVSYPDELQDFGPIGRRALMTDNDKWSEIRRSSEICAWLAYRVIPNVACNRINRNEIKSLVGMESRRWCLKMKWITVQRYKWLTMFNQSHSPSLSQYDTPSFTSWDPDDNPLSPPPAKHPTTTTTPLEIVTSATPLPPTFAGRY